MASFKKRKVIERDIYIAGRDALLSQFPRLEKELRGLIEKMRVDPVQFPRVLGFEARRARTDTFLPEVPDSYAVWFNHDKDTVYLELIELWDFDLPVPPDDESTLGEDD